MNLDPRCTFCSAAGRACGHVWVPDTSCKRDELFDEYDADAAGAVLNPRQRFGRAVLAVLRARHRARDEAARVRSTVAVLPSGPSTPSVQRTRGISLEPCAFHDLALAHTQSPSHCSRCRADCSNDAIHARRARARSQRRGAPSAAAQTSIVACANVYSSITTRYIQAIGLFFIIVLLIFEPGAAAEHSCWSLRERSSSSRFSSCCTPCY